MHSSKTMKGEIQEEDIHNEYSSFTVMAPITLTSSELFSELSNLVLEK